MKNTIDAKRYDSEKMEVLGERNCYSSSNNYCGTDYLLRASDGQKFVLQTSNGQDCFRGSDKIYPYIDEFDMTIDEFDMTDEQEKRCEELGLIEIVE